MEKILDYNSTLCQEEYDDQPGFYSLNRQFIQECSEFVYNINNMEDSPWKNKDIVQWIRGDLKQQIGQGEIKVLRFLQQEYFLKNSPCFCKHNYIANKLDLNISFVSSIICKLDKKGYIIKISWLYKGRRKNSMLLPQIPSLIETFNQKNMNDAEYRKKYNKFRKLFPNDSIVSRQKKGQKDPKCVEHINSVCNVVNSQHRKNALTIYTNILYSNTLFNTNKVTLNTVLNNSSITICKQMGTLEKSPKVPYCSDNESVSKTNTVDNYKVDTHIESNKALVDNKGLKPNRAIDYRFQLKSRLIDDKALVIIKELDQNRAIDSNETGIDIQDPLNSNSVSFDNKGLDSTDTTFESEEFEYESTEQITKRLYASGETFESEIDLIDRIIAEKELNKMIVGFSKDDFKTDVECIQEWEGNKKPPRSRRGRNRTENYRPLTDKELNAYMRQLNAVSTTQFTYQQKVEFLKQQKEEEQRLIEERNQKIIKSTPVAVIDYPSIPDHENRFKTILNQDLNLIDDLLADNLLNEVKSSIMLDRHLLKRKIRNENFIQKDTVKRLADNDYDFDKIPVYDQNWLNDYISCFHSIDMKIHFKIPANPEFRKKPYINHVINIRRSLLRLISTGNEIEWDYADKVIEYWNKLPIKSGEIKKIRIGAKDSKTYVNAAIVISDCLIHGANRNLNVMFRAMDRLKIAEDWKKPPFNFQAKPSIVNFFLIHEKNKLIKTYFGNEIEFEKFLYAKKYKKKNLERLEVGYKRFTELYVNQFYVDHEEKGREVCFRYEHLIKKWLEEKIEDIKNTCHKSGRIQRKMYAHSLIMERQDEYGNVPPLLQRFFYYINREYYGSIPFIAMFEDKTWNQFIEKHMRIEVGLVDFWEPIFVKKNGNGNGRKKTSYVTTRSTGRTRISATA